MYYLNNIKRAVPPPAEAVVGVLVSEEVEVVAGRVAVGSHYYAQGPRRMKGQREERGRLLL